MDTIEPGVGIECATFLYGFPEALFRAGGWRNAVVVRPGQPAANFGRLTGTPEAKGAGQQANLRTYLVAATL
ncbi:hypothetical protein [Arthrobacter ramosus]|uniref:Uncharacterized protein n=1 Tax=Arthrobacter ramosus TaxID=1672 RepID=A0ABV5XX18_ARTRM|nr:hypothetical protein [Arthrobacter ramosus]